MTGNPKPGMGSANQVLDKIPDNFFPEGTVIMGSEPLAGIELKDMEEPAADVTSSEEIVKVFAAVHNKFWFIEDEVYDYEEGSEDYYRISAIVDAWEKGVQK